MYGRGSSAVEYALCSKECHLLLIECDDVIRMYGRGTLPIECANRRAWDLSHHHSLCHIISYYRMRKQESLGPITAAARAPPRGALSAGSHRMCSPTLECVPFD